MRGQRSADDPAFAGRELDDVLGDARLVHQLDRERANQRRLPGRLGDYGIARSQRPRNQACEDSERKIPRRYAGEHSAAVEAQLVLLPGWARQRHRLGELTARLRGIEAQEIDRLAHFEDGVGQCLAGFADAQREEFFSMRFVEVSRAFEQPGARFAAERIPIDLRRMAGADHAIDVCGACFDDFADDDPVVERCGNRLALTLRSQG